MARTLRLGARRRLTGTVLVGMIACTALAIAQAPAQVVDFEISAEALRAAKVSDVEAELRAAVRKGQSISKALWRIEQHAKDSYRASQLNVASEWVDLLERITKDEWLEELLALYAAIDRAQIQIRLGWPDLADARRAVIAKHLQRIPLGDSNRDYGVAASGVFDLDLALAIEAFDQVIEIAAALEPKLSAPVRTVFANEIESRVALARYGLARRNPDSTAVAVAALDRRIDSGALDAQTCARHALSIADLEMRRADSAAAQRALDRAQEFLDRAGEGIAAELRANHAALRVRLALDHGVGRDEIERWEAILDAALAEVFRAAGVDGGVAMRPFADAGGPPGFLHFGSLQEPLIERIRARERGASAADAFQCVLDAQAAGWLSRSKRTTLAEVRHDLLVDDDHALLVFVPGPTRVLAFTVTRRTIRMHELASAIELENIRDQLERFLGEPLTDPQRAQFHEASAYAARAHLPADLLAEIASCRRWSISAMGSLATLAFEALTVGGEVLGLTHEIDRVPSLSFAVDAGRRPHAIAPGAAAVVRIVAPEISPEQRTRFPELAALDFARASVTAIESIYGAGVVETRFGSAAGFPKGLEPLPRIVEFYAHGVVLADSVRPSALAVTPTAAFPSGFIDSAALRGWPAPQLVILAVCAATQGPYRAGNEGSMSLAGSLLDLGAECVIGSQRRIEARATLALLTHLHRALAAGESPAAALRSARAALVAERGVAHPSEFALLTAIGAGQRPIFAPSDRRALEGERASVSQDAGSRGFWRVLAASCLAALVVGWTLRRLLRRQA